jgi:hypothetical protein
VVEGGATMKTFDEMMSGVSRMKDRWMPAAQPAGADTNGKNTALFSNPATKGLFDHWVSTVEAEILALLKEKDSVDVRDLAVRVKMPEEIVIAFISKMVEEGKLKIRTVGMT